MISVRGLRKEYLIHRKEPGLAASLKSLFKRRFESVVALEGADLEVGPGEIVGLLGANGAGKTTLVKMLSGILYPTSGEARVLGHVPWLREDAFRSRISLIMGQKAQLWWDLPAGDSFLLLREIYRVPREEHARRLAELTGALGVESKLSVQLRRLSLGERMKMELIAALLHRPQAVFLDEPTLGLDLTAQQTIRQFLLEYRQRHQPAMILTSHYMEDIRRLCPRVVVIRKGRFVYDGPLGELPASFDRTKILTVQLRPGAGERAPWPKALGRASWNGDILTAHVPRKAAAEAAAHALATYAVEDLSLAEEDIGEVVEALIREGGREADA